jgi:hypothetical protein
MPDDIYALTRLCNGDFQDVVCKVRLPINFFEHESEEEPLKIKVHPSRSIDADEAGMEWNIGEHSFRTRRIEGWRVRKVYFFLHSRSPMRRFRWTEAV